jgi:hypothetical protein
LIEIDCAAFGRTGVLGQTSGRRIVKPEPGLQNSVKFLCPAFGHVAVDGTCLQAKYSFLQRREHRVIATDPLDLIRSQHSLPIAEDQARTRHGFARRFLKVKQGGSAMHTWDTQHSDSSKEPASRGFFNRRTAPIWRFIRSAKLRKDARKGRRSSSGKTIRSIFIG